MRNHFIKIFIVLVLIVSACTHQKNKDQIVIGLAMDTYSEERWKKDAGFFEERAAQLGVKVIRQVCNGNEQLQNEQVENLLTQGIDVLVIVPHNSKTAAEAVNSARQSNVPVIAYDRMIKDCDLNLYISFDNEKVGMLQGEYAAKQAPKGNYVFMQGSPTDENAYLYEKGQMKILKPLIDRGDVKVVMSQFCKDWLPAEAFRQMQNALTLTGNNIAAVVVANDGLAGGVIQALVEQQIAGEVVVTGQDAELAAIQRITSGIQNMTVYKPIKLLAYKGAEAAVALAKGKQPDGFNSKIDNGKKVVDCILLEPLLVDKNNYEATVIKDGFIDKTKLNITQ